LKNQQNLKNQPGKSFSKNQHFADFSACSGSPGLKRRFILKSILAE
jgi:hypothetical protein